MFDAYPRYEHALAQLQLLFFMLGMGATLRPREFLQVLGRPRSLVSAALGQIFVLPLLGWGLAHLFRLDAGLAVGLILVAAMPGGTLSKVFTFVGRGNIALSISLTVVTTLASVVSVPLLLRVLAADYIPEDFEMPLADMFFELGLFLVLPVLVGMVLARLLPDAAPRLARWCVRLGFVVVVVMVVGSLGSGRIKPGEHGMLVPFVLILFCLLGQQLNMLLFYVFRWPRADRLAAGIEVTMRNMNLALLLKSILFRDDSPLGPLGAQVLFVILFYAAVAMFAGLPLALNHRRLSRRELAVG